MIISILRGWSQARQLHNCVLQGIETKAVSWSTSSAHLSQLANTRASLSDTDKHDKEDKNLKTENKDADKIIGVTIWRIHKELNAHIPRRVGPAIRSMFVCCARSMAFVSNIQSIVVDVNDWTISRLIQTCIYRQTLLSLYIISLFHHLCSLSRSIITFQNWSSIV